MQYIAKQINDYIIHILYNNIYPVSILNTGYIIYWQKSCKENARHKRERAATCITPHMMTVNIALSVAWGCTHAETTRILCKRVRSHNFLCMYVTKHEYNPKITRFLLNFLMDDTLCIIRQPMGNF